MAAARVSSARAAASAIRTLIQQHQRGSLLLTNAAATAGPSTAAAGTLHSQRRRRSTHEPADRPRWIHSSSPRQAHFSFDTSSLVARLEKEGLTREQALGVMEALEEVIEESIRTMTANLVTRAEQEKHQYTQKVDFAKLKSEITLLEKQDFSLLKSENERLLSKSALYTYRLPAC